MGAEASREAATAKRRMGPSGSPSWNLLLDAAEAVLRDEGYAAFSSRTIAARAGVNQQLVYYYFHSMEELIVAAFRRSAEREMARLEAAAASDRPLHGIWQVRSQKRDLRPMSEFAALASRIPDLGAEIVAFRQKVRRLQVEALQRSLGDREAPLLELRAPALVALLDYVALQLKREIELGAIEGQRELVDGFEAFLDRIEDGPD